MSANSGKSLNKDCLSETEKSKQCFKLGDVLGGKEKKKERAHLIKHSAFFISYMEEQKLFTAFPITSRSPGDGTMKK